MGEDNNNNEVERMGTHQRTLYGAFRHDQPYRGDYSETEVGTQRPV